MATQKNFKADGLVSSNNNAIVGPSVRLTSGQIYGYQPTVISTSAEISIIATANPVTVTFAAPVFAGVGTGTLQISGVTTTTEANGLWYFRASSDTECTLYTDVSFSTEVDGSGWTPYFPTEIVQNTNIDQDNTIIVNSLDYPNVDNIGLGWSANDGVSDYVVVSVINDFPDFGQVSLVMNGGTFASPAMITFTGIAGSGVAEVISLSETSVSIATLNRLFEFTNQGNITMSNGSINPINNDTGIQITSISSGNVVLTTPALNNVTARGDGNVSITSTGVSTHTWLFNTTGGITFPDFSVQATAYDITTEPRFDVKINNFTAASNKRYGINTSFNEVTATLPNNPSVGDAVFFADAGGAFSIYNFTIDAGLNTIMSGSSTQIVNTNGATVGLFWNGSTWRSYN